MEKLDKFKIEKSYVETIFEFQVLRLIIVYLILIIK